MKKVLLVVLALTACAKSVAVNPGTFIIGDSISVGYQPFVPNSTHTNFNDQSSGYGAQNIQNWVPGYWATCTLNHGIWDALGNVDVETYRSNMLLELAVLKQHCIKIVLVGSTRIPNNTIADSFILQYNKILQSMNVSYCELYNLTSDYLPNDMHFTQAGYQTMANKVQSCL